MVSAVVLAYNRCAEVLITIARLKEYGSKLPFPLEIIVVDNASNDDTTPVIRQQYPDITLVTKIKNNGIAGWNDGFIVATHKYLLVLDDDSHPESGMEAAVEFMESHAETGILALNITAGPYLTDTWVWKTGKPWQHEQEIIGFFGCGAIIRKKVYETIGGFANWMSVYGHEWEYGIRCIDAGYKIRYYKNSSINHRASSVNRSLKRARIFGTRNEMGIVYIYFGNQKWKYIFRMFINNFKRLKDEGILSAYYDILGAVQFLKIKGKLIHKPVSVDTQQFFADNYMNTNPIFGFLSTKKKWKLVINALCIYIITI